MSAAPNQEQYKELTEADWEVMKRHGYIIHLVKLTPVRKATPNSPRTRRKNPTLHKKQLIHPDGLAVWSASFIISFEDGSWSTFSLGLDLVLCPFYLPAGARVYLPGLRFEGGRAVASHIRPGRSGEAE